MSIRVIEESWKDISAQRWIKFFEQKVTDFKPGSLIKTSSDCKDFHQGFSCYCWSNGVLYQVSGFTPEQTRFSQCEVDFFFAGKRAGERNIRTCQMGHQTKVVTQLASNRNFFLAPLSISLHFICRIRKRWEVVRAFTVRQGDQEVGRKKINFLLSEKKIALWLGSLLLARIEGWSKEIK